MQAAFIDIGLERAAFLHVEDLIRPDDFEAYLGGGKRPDEEEAPTEPSDVAAEASAAPEAAREDEGAADTDEPEAVPDTAAEGVEIEIDAAPDSGEPEADTLIEGEEPAMAASAEVDEADDATEPDEVPVEELAAAPVADLGKARAARTPVPTPPPAARAQSGAAAGVETVGRSEPHRFRSKRLSRRGGRNQKNGKSAHGRARNGQRDASRLSRSTPIREVVREGQEVIVQISKEPIGTKGARVTSHISLPGRYVVYMPTLDQIGISKRIGSDKERARLREAIEGIKPPTGGLIVRTVAEGLTKKQLKADVGYLVRLWAEVAKKRESGGKAPALLYQELDLVLKTARDLFSDEIEQIVIDDREQYQRLVRFVEMFMPERAKDIVLYSGDEPIFDAYGIEDEIGRALSRKVPLPSGGYLIIDQAEALTAIDVNTGRYVGKGSKDLEDTLFKTNMEAVEEIAYQLRFRNLGGLIVLDLIDMERASNREKIRRRLEELLQKDKAKTTLNRISDLGLIEMTRKRTRESLGRLLHEPCFYCDGTGQLQSKQTIAYEILRQIRRDRASLPGYSVVVNAHPAVIDVMKGEEREAVQEAERRFMRRIELVPRREYHLEQFDLAGK
jgi:ribonuclease G